MQPRLYGFILKRLADRDQTLEVLQKLATGGSLSENHLILLSVTLTALLTK
jgi:hypothetical protein